MIFMNGLVELIQDLLGSIYKSFINYGSEYFRYTILSFFAFEVIFKKQFADYKIQTKRKVRAKKIFFEFVYSCLTLIVAGVVIWVVDNLLIGNRPGLFYGNDYDKISDYGWLYFFASIFLMLVFNDTYFYWMHRLLHHPKLYRRIHKIHHNSTAPNAFTSYSFHPCESAILIFGRIITTSLIPVHSLAVNIWLFLDLLNTIGQHLGYEFYPQWFTRSRWLNWKTPVTHHDLHHERSTGNYALTFTWWDKLMGTELPDYQAQVEVVQQRKQRYRPSVFQKKRSR